MMGYMKTQWITKVILIQRGGYNNSLLEEPRYITCLVYAICIQLVFLKLIIP